MIFLFILVFGVIFLFLNIRQIAPGNKGSIIAGVIVTLLPLCFLFRSHFIACLGQAFLSVWLCEALLIYIIWNLGSGLFRILKRHSIAPKTKIIAARIIFAASIIITSLMCFIGYFNNLDYKIVEANIALSTRNANNSTKSFTILYFSDIHLNPLFNSTKVHRIIQDADSLKPDFILFGGDFADIHDSTISANGYDPLFSELASKASISAFAINGNHEGYMERSGSNPKGWLQKNNFTVLDDSTVCTPLACFTGRTDFQVAKTRDLERKSLAQLNPSFYYDSTYQSLPWLLMDHQPKGIEKGHIGRLPDLAFSGHTHDGQFFPGTIIINWVWRLAYGLGELDSVKWIVTSGVDSWGPPVRIGSNTEMWFVRVHY